MELFLKCKIALTFVHDVEIDSKVCACRDFTITLIQNKYVNAGSIRILCHYTIH